MPENENEYDIRVTPRSVYIEAQSDPQRDRYVFAYTVTIRNEGGAPAKLLRRHWIITDGNGDENEVRGDGVVGEQPHLKPGEGFRYTSGAILRTPVGTMRGSYQLVDDEGVEFDAPIEPFLLAMPGSVN